MKNLTDNELKIKLKQKRCLHTESSVKLMEKLFDILKEIKTQL